MSDTTELLDRVRGEVSGYGFTDYLRNLPAVEQATADATPLRVAVLRSYTAESIEPVLKLRLALDGFRPTFWFGGFNQYVQDVVDPAGPLRAFAPDLILLLVRIEELLPDLIDDYPSHPASHWSSRIEAKAREIGSLAQQVERSFKAQLIVQNAVLPTGYFGIFDAQRREGERYLVQEFNRLLADQLAPHGGAFIWDFDRFVTRHGYDDLFDPKMWYLSANPYRQAAYPAIGEDLTRYIRSAFGRTKKCVVLDLDNTLWGGIIGEDGFEGIGLGHTYPGNCYRDFQKELLKLHHRGILLAINSKNNPDDAFRVIDDHPDMLLRRKHFAATRINWNDKGANLREIARELNIGVDSLIFIDDNPVECERIRRECPECEVVLLPTQPYLIPRVPSDLPGVENIRLTAEDRQKGEMYRAQAERQALEEQVTNLDEFLASLEIEADIEAATPFSIPRIAQLTQKTNQLNMTTRRYTEAQIQALAADPSSAVYSVSSRDRFGDNGIIGVFILRFAGEECLIDSFLLSCRVIGRGIENLMAAFIADVAREGGAPTIIGEFFPTAKNQPAAGMYERLGFIKETDSRMRVDLVGTSLPYPPHIRFAARRTGPESGS